MNFRVEHRLGVPVPAPVLWEVIRDLEAWPSWNPAYPKAKGRLGIGERLELTERSGGQDRSLTARVVDWIPNEQILWAAAEMGGLAKRLRFIELEVLSPSGSLLSNGEIFSGMLAKSAFGGRKRDLARAYAEMSEAIKVRAEAAWAAMGEAERKAAMVEAPIPPPDVPLPKIDAPRPIKGFFGKR